jgi:pimeloyl-ACP methyl ester carboxylesterase
MARNPVVLIHGYSSEGEAFKHWVKGLKSRGYDDSTIYTCSYRSLTDEVTLKDLAEGFDRALRMQEGLKDDQPFDAIVHSTGMLVIRAWLTTYKGRRDRLKRLIGLAPATFGSPLAHKGRSWLGATFKGNRVWGPDFMEAGDQVLDALELGSSFTWELAHKDLIGTETIYGEDAGTPYVFVFCGTKGYDGIARLVNEPGTDGTVRWAGAALNTRKISLDLTQDPQRPDARERILVEPWRKNIRIPLIPLPELNHSSIMSNPDRELPGLPNKKLLDLVDDALRVSSKQEFDNWHKSVEPLLQRAKSDLESRQQEWQQFVVRAVDERGDPIRDYYIQLLTRNTDGIPATLRELEVDIDVHSYSRDRSYRCLHVNLSKIKPSSLKNLYVRIIASSGSELVGYHGYGSENDSIARQINPDGTWDAVLDLSSLLPFPSARHDKKPIAELFYPLTTTLVELRLNREPLPLMGENKVCWFLKPETKSLSR